MSKRSESIGKNVKTRTPCFWHRMVNHGDKKRSENGHFFPTHCFFLHFSWYLPTTSAQGPIPNRQKRHFFTRGPNPKVLIMRWKRSQPPKHPEKEQSVPRWPFCHGSVQRLPPHHCGSAMAVWPRLCPAAPFPPSRFRCTKKNSSVEHLQWRNIEN